MHRLVYTAKQSEIQSGFYPSFKFNHNSHSKGEEKYADSSGKYLDNWLLGHYDRYPSNIRQEPEDQAGKTNNKSNESYFITFINE